jgi:hypothetical protein
VVVVQARRAELLLDPLEALVVVVLVERLMATSITVKVQEGQDNQTQAVAVVVVLVMVLEVELVVQALLLFGTRYKQTNKKRRNKWHTSQK